MPDQIDLALTDAIANYVAKRPKTAAMHERACTVMPGGNTRTVLFSNPFSIRITRAAGAKLTDIDGHHYTDFVGEYSAGIFGHSHPKIIAAVADAMAMGLNIGAQHEREVVFAEAVTQRFALERVRFTNSGTEANMMALAAARNFVGRPAIMAMEGGYHGGTLYFSHGASPVNAPFDVVMGKFNDIATTKALIEANASRLAAVILEPMLGGGGCIVADLAFLQMLRQVCDTHNIVLIFDEVMTSRLHPSGISGKTGVKPDLTTLGKYIGGGMSFGAFGGRSEIMDQFDPTKPNALPHAGTFNNNTVTMTAGLVGLTEIYTPDVCVSHNARGEVLKSRLNGLFMEHQAPLQVTGIGTLLTLHPIVGEITNPDHTAKADMRIKRLIYFHLLEDGIYIAERGFMALSLAVSQNDDDALIDSLQRFVEKYRVLLLQ